MGGEDCVSERDQYKMRESPTGPCNINTKVGIVTALISHHWVQPRSISGTRPSSDNRSNVTSAGTVKIDLFSPNCQFTLPRPMTNEWDHIGGILNIPRILRQIFLLISGQTNKAKQIKRNGGESRMQIKFLSSPNSWQKSLKIRELQRPQPFWTPCYFPQLPNPITFLQLSQEHTLKMKGPITYIEYNACFKKYLRGREWKSSYLLVQSQRPTVMIWMVLETQSKFLTQVAETQLTVCHYLPLPRTYISRAGKQELKLGMGLQHSDVGEAPTSILLATRPLQANNLQAFILYSMQKCTEHLACATHYWYK